MRMINIFFKDTDIGTIGIGEKEGKIVSVYFENDPIPKNHNIKETSTLNSAFYQLDLYLKGELSRFNLEFILNGTSFQKKVWNELLNIPYGQVRSYKEIAIQIGSPKAYRAVGMANNKNIIPIFIPCHRVIGSNGDLVGYRGGLDIKKHLLNLERN